MRLLWQRVSPGRHLAKPHKRQAVSNAADSSMLPRRLLYTFSLSLHQVRSLVLRLNLYLLSSTSLHSPPLLFTLLLFSAMLTPRPAPARSPTAASSHPVPRPLRTSLACTATWRLNITGCRRTRGRSVWATRRTASLKTPRRTPTVKTAHLERPRKPMRAAQAQVAERGRRAGQCHTPSRRHRRPCTVHSTSRHLSCQPSLYPRRQPRLPESR